MNKSVLNVNLPSFEKGYINVKLQNIICSLKIELFDSNIFS
jgi:hypothetical protein